MGGWNLINRFSEDVDIFLDPHAYEPTHGKRAIDRELKALRDAVAEHPAFTFVNDESQTIGGFGRNDRFSYPQRFGGAGEVANRVLVEAERQVGVNPPPSSNCVHTSRNSSLRNTYRWAPTTRVLSRCGC